MKLLPVTGDHRWSQVWTTVKSILLCIAQCVRYLWEHNPVKVLTERQRRLYFVENYGGLVIKPKLKERMVDLFLTDFRRRKRLLHWVQTKLRTTEVHDFCTCWHDGTVLCALLESICPGVCPSFHLLSPLNMVKNCRLGIKLANKYLYVPMDLLTPEEMAIATNDTEFKIIQYVSMIKWASQNIREKWTVLHESLIAAKTGRCFAKGSGLRNGIVGKRSKFTIVVSDTIGVFNLLVEVRGPNNDYSGERIVSLHQAKGVLEKSSEGTRTWNDSVKYLEDCVGNTFVRKKVQSRFAADNQTDLMVLDFQSGEEGTFYVTFVPRRAGIHAVSVKWQNHHVENSPFRIKVYKASNVSTKSLKGAQEKRVIFDSLSLATIPGTLEEGLDLLQTRNHQHGYELGESPANVISKSKAYSKGRQLTVTSRRVLRRIITRNGEDIVIEEAVSPTLSRQSSITDNSDDDRYSRRDRGDKNTSPKSQSTQDVTSSVTSKPTTSLGTVLEEKQNSRENMFKGINLSDLVSSREFKQRLEEYNSKSTIRLQHESERTGNDETEAETKVIKSRGDPSVKYKCTELNEHNVLETYERKTEEASEVDKEMVSSWFTLPENDGQWMERNVVKRSRLKRSTSIKGQDKVTAHRTTSDGTIYSLRRKILSLAASDSSEVSSDDRQSGNDDEYGVVVPSLKLLHSHSLKKACMYMSKKRYPKDDAMDDFITTETLLEKPKVKSTQSLPILANESVNQTDHNLDSKGLKTSERLLKLVAANPNLSPREIISDVIKSTAKIQTAPENTKHDSFDKRDTDLGGISGDHEKKRASEVVNASSHSTKASNIETENKVVSRHEQFINRNVFVNVLEDDSDLPESTSANHYHKTTLYTDIKPPSEKSVRGTLTRQWTVVCQRSSQSSSETGNGNDAFKDGGQQESPSKQNTTTLTKQEADTPSSSTNAQFKSIFVQSEGENGPPVTQEVVIIVPKPKVDKQTQVSHKEITQETGWDLFEGVYLLLRRISVKVPCITTCPPSTGSLSSSDLNKIYGKIRKRGSSTNGSRCSLNESKERATSIIGSSSESNQLHDTEHNIGNSPSAPSELNQLHVPSLSDTERNIGNYSSAPSELNHLQVPSMCDTERNIGNPSSAPSELNHLQVPSMSDTERAASDTSSLKASTTDCSFKVSDISNVNHSVDVRRNHDHDLSKRLTCVNNTRPDFANGADPHVRYSSDIPVCTDYLDDAFDQTSDKRHLFPDSGLFPSCGRYKYEAVSEWFRRNDNFLRTQHRQGTVETADSGFDDNPATFNRNARFSLPTLRTVSANGHIKLHRRPYKGKILLEPDLVNSFNSMSLDKKDLGNEADDELLLSSSFERRQNKTQRRRHKLCARETSFSFSDSEINPNKQRRRRSIGLSRRGKEMALRRNDGVDNTDMTSREEKPYRVDSIEISTDDNKDVEGIDETGNQNKPVDIPQAAGESNACSRKEVVKKSSTTASSMDSNYCGFGVSKTNRNVFLSHIGQFQNLCTTEEVPDDSLSGISRHSVNSSVNETIDNIDDTKNFDPANMKVNVDETETTDQANFKDIIDGTKSLNQANYIEQTDRRCTKTDKHNNFIQEQNLDSSIPKNETDVRLYGQVNSDSLTTISDLSTLNYENGTITSDSDVRSSYIDTSYINENRDTFRDLMYIDEQAGLSVQRLIESQNGYVRNTLVLDPGLNDVDLDQDEGNAMIHVAGAGLHQSLVGANNSFQVWTEHLTTGSLSVNISGPRPHTVTETSVLYTGDNLYEVSYGVTQPGLYRIHVKWGDSDIPNSPFLCTAVLM